MNEVDVKALLRSVAEEMPVSSSMPSRLRRRVLVRRAVTAGAVTVVAAVIAAGGYAGARFASEPRFSDRPPGFAADTRSVRCLSPDEPSLISCRAAVRLADASGRRVAEASRVEAKLVDYGPFPRGRAWVVIFQDIPTFLSGPFGRNGPSCVLGEMKVVLRATDGKILDETTLGDGDQPCKESDEDGTWEGIWPQGSRQEAEEAQAASDAGDPDFTWQTDARTTVRRYARQVLGWKQPHFLGALVRRDHGATVVASISTCRPERPPGCGTDALEAQVRLARLLRNLPTGIWSIVGVRGPRAMLVEAEDAVEQGRKDALEEQARREARRMEAALEEARLRESIRERRALGPPMGSCPARAGALRPGGNAMQHAERVVAEFVRALVDRGRDRLSRLLDPSVPAPFKKRVTSPSLIPRGSDLAVIDAGPGTTEPPGSSVKPWCGRALAERTWWVMLDDLTESSSLDSVWYLVRRADGWKIWGVF